MEKVAIRDGSGTDAIERLFREEGRYLWRALVAFTGGRREIADDAAAEAFAQALRYSSSIRDEKAWLYRTAFRAAARELRREKRHVRGDSDLPKTDPHEEQVVLPTLRHLSRNQRASIVLHYYLGFPVREIARMMGMSPATVKVHLHRGRRRLERLLSAEERDD